MKKGIKTMVIAVVVTIGSTAFGQSLNFSGGYSMSWMTMDGMTDATSSESYNGTNYTRSTDYKGLSGYNFSIGYEFNLGKRLSLETGVKYQTRGYKMIDEYKSENGIDTYNERSLYKTNLNYLDIPIILNTDFIIREDLRVYARTGLYAGFMVNMKFSERSEYSSSDGDNGVYEYEGSYSDVDFEDRIGAGLIVGAGAEYKGFYFETNYNAGVLSVANFSDGAFTRDLSFSLGYKIKFN